MPSSETTESAAPTPTPTQSGLAPRVTISLILIALIVGAGIFGYRKLVALKKEPPRIERTPERTAVRVQVARRGPHRESLTGYGRARALRRANVPAEIAATITWLSPNLDAGRTVEAGEILVRLDASDARSDANAAQARLAQAEARRLRAASDKQTLLAQAAVSRRELEASERELERLRELVSKATSESEVDGQRMAVALREQSLIGLKGRHAAADADERSAEAEMEAAKSALERARHDVARADVRAPYDGSIVVRSAQLGERVTPGTALFSIVDLRHIEIPVSLPASRHGEVVPGAKAVVRLREGGDAIWTGIVSRVSPACDAERRTFDVYIDVEADADQLAAPVAPGVFAVVTVDGRVTPGTVAVPREAFVAGALYVAEPSGDADPITGARPARVREIRPESVRRLPDVILVGDGLDEGSLVIVTGVDQVADGAHVFVLPVRDADEDGDASGNATDGIER